MTNPGLATSAVSPEARREIEALSVEYAWLGDHGRAEMIAELFTEDATLDVGELLTGMAEIRTALRKRAEQDILTRHLVTNIRLHGQDDGTVHGTVLLTVLLRKDGGTVNPERVVAEADDVYALCADGRWRFARRAVAVVFTG